MKQFSSSCERLSGLCPEDRLLIHCARTILGPERKKLIRDLVRAPIDWDYLVENALVHGVMPLLYRSLQSTCPQDVPSITLRTLQFQFLANAARNHLLNQRLLRILKRLNSHRISAVPIKGPVLAAYAYRNISLRQFGDLDILVHKRDAIRAKSCVETFGYSTLFKLMPKFEALQLRYQQHFSLVSDSSDTPVELHWTLEPGKTWSHFSDVTLWQRLETTILDGVPLLHLSPEDLLLYLCVHGSNHCWERLSWICDVAELLGTQSNMDWAALIEQARLIQRRRMLFLGLFLATNLLEVSIPHEIRKMAEGHSAIHKLAKLSQKRLFGRKQQGSLRLGPAFSFRLMARESVSDKLLFCLERFVFPDPLDLQFVNLPSFLFSLYFAVRPIRLIGKYCWDYCPRKHNEADL